MYHYFQEHEKGRWHPVPAGKGAERRVRDSGGIKMTVLAVSELISDETERSDLRYRGPLYFDIDCSDDLRQAAQSAWQLYERLREMDVAEAAIRLYASGGKGFHVMVPAKVFSAGRPTKNLPRIYATMALGFYVHGLDFQVYSGGRGNCWRLTNLEREDGNYRVLITAAELRALAEAATAEAVRQSYQVLVSAPRPDAPVPEDELTAAPALAAAYEKARKQVTDRVIEREASGVRPVTDEELATLEGEPPACVEALAGYKVKGRANFNQAGLQFAAWAARSGAEKGVWRPLANRMADNGTSSKYTSPRERVEHVESLVRFAQYAKGLKFSCHAMRSVVGVGPCESCPLAEKTLVDQAHEDGLDLNIERREDGYYITGQDKDRRVSTFVLDPVNETVEKSQGAGGIDRRVSTQMRVRSQGMVLGHVSFEEGGWASKSAFIRQIEGIDNLSFLGTDSDVQRIKHIVYHEGQEMGEIVRVHASGVHLHQVADRQIFVYVEPGFSINQVRVKGTHEIGGKLPVAPQLKSVKLPQSEGQRQIASEALQALLQVNSRETVAQLAGWFAACHLKTHCMKRYTQFPILSLWGNAGSGKTVSASLFAWLNGVDYTLNDSPMNVSSVTPWAMVAYCSSSTTIPRLLDEYNKSKMMRRQYDQSGEIIKAAWNGQVIARGTLSKSRANGRTGAEVAETPITGPLVILSEQAPDTPAVQQRTIQVMMSRKAREGCDGHFERASELRDHLRGIAKAMVIESLRTPITWVEDRVAAHKESVPREVDERPRYSFQVALMGLDFLEKCAHELELDDAGLIEEARAALIAYLDERSHEISKAKHRTEVDAVLEDIGTMVTLSVDDTDRWINYGRHIMLDEEHRRLYLDVPIVHAMYLRFKGRSDQVPLDRVSQFAALLKQELYFVSDSVAVEAMNPSRPVWALDLDRMEEKGHLTSLFQGRF